METLREKFLTVCQGCDGSGMIEEPLMIMGEIVYKDVVCECEDGKELDWEKIYSEIKQTELHIELLKTNVKVYNEITREYLEKDLNDLCIHALKGLVRFENELESLENYLAELEVIE